MKTPSSHCAATATLLAVLGGRATSPRRQKTDTKKTILPMRGATRTGRKVRRMSLATPQLPPAPPAGPAPSSARRILLLGGIRSGKSAVAETIVAAAAFQGMSPVRYIATANPQAPDPSWTARIAAHQARRPEEWTTSEISDNPDKLVELLTEAAPEEILLVDDLGGWLTTVFETAGRWDDPHLADERSCALAAAVAACPSALLVLVSPEVGLTVVPAIEAGRTFADASGTLNAAIAAVCDAVGLVIAGRTAWLSATLPPISPAPPAPEAAATVEVTVAVAAATGTGAGTGAGTAAGADAEADADAEAEVTVEPEPSEAEPAQPDEAERGETVPAEEEPSLPVYPAYEVSAPNDARADLATQRLRDLDVSGPGLGALAAVARFAAATQDRDVPTPWNTITAFLLHGDHLGALSDVGRLATSARRLAEASAGEGILALLAAESQVAITGVECPTASPIEEGDALSDDAVEQALELGTQLADRAIDAGTDLVVLAACGAGSDIAAMTVVVMFAGGEPSTLIPRADLADGRIDDEAWMRWCVAARDALFRVRDRNRAGRAMLSALGGGDLAVATGILLQAAQRRTPVLIDGPVGAAAALVAREMAGETPRWLLLADHGGHPTTKLAATVLSLPQITDFHLGLGEGCGSLTALPVIQATLRVVATVSPAPSEDA